MPDEPKEEDKGLMETVFGTTTCNGKKGLMFVGFIAPAGLGDLARMFTDPTQIESVLKRAQEEAAKREAEKERPAAATAVGRR